MEERHYKQNVNHQDELTNLVSKLNGVFTSGTASGTPATETAHAHTLGRIPRGFFILSSNNAGVVYNGTTANTDALIHIRSSVASTAFIIYVF